MWFNGYGGCIECNRLSTEQANENPQERESVFWFEENDTSPIIASAGGGKHCQDINCWDL